MEQGSPSKSPSSSLEQTKQSYYDLLMSHEYDSGMPYYLACEKPLRIIETDEPQSYLSLLTSIQKSEAQPSLISRSMQVPYAHLNSQSTYSMLDMKPEISAPFRPMAAVPNGNKKLANGGSNYAQGSSRLKRKISSEDDTASNIKSSNSYYRGDKGYCSSTSGQRYTLYDERYQALGLPVDPHLRIFNAVYGKGKNDFSKP